MSKNTGNRDKGKEQWLKKKRKAHPILVLEFNKSDHKKIPYSHLLIKIKIRTVSFHFK